MRAEHARADDPADRVVHGVAGEGGGEQHAGRDRCLQGARRAQCARREQQRVTR